MSEIAVAQGDLFTAPLPLAPLRKRVATARRLGHAAGAAASAAAEERDPTFGARALEFIVAYVRLHGDTSGESLTLAARAAGICPRDDRAFGPVYAKAIRRGLLRVVGYVPRVRGHGTDGGRVYGVGVSE